MPVRSDDERDEAREEIRRREPSQALVDAILELAKTIDEDADRISSVLEDLDAIESELHAIRRTLSDIERKIT